MAGERPTHRVGVFIDYQNVMNGARQAICDHPYRSWDGQIWPARFAHLLVSRTPLGAGDAERQLAYVRVYRGRPDPRKEPQTYAAHMRQCQAWASAGTDVITRSLRYPANWPDEKSEEKGIDVQIAIDMVTEAINRRIEVAILASADTDQRPVLEAFHNLPMDPKPTVEVASWKSPWYSQKLQVKGLHVWSHYMEEADYHRVRDGRDYNRK